MRCSLLTLSSYVDDELEAHPRGDLEGHLVGCRRCRAGVGYLREEVERIGALALAHVPDHSVHTLFEQLGLLGAADPLPYRSEREDDARSLDAPPWLSHQTGKALPWRPPRREARRETALSPVTIPPPEVTPPPSAPSQGAENRASDRPPATPATDNGIPPAVPPGSSPGVGASRDDAGFAGPAPAEEGRGQWIRAGISRDPEDAPPTGIMAAAEPPSTDPITPAAEFHAGPGDAPLSQPSAGSPPQGGPQAVPMLPTVPPATTDSEATEKWDDTAVLSDAEEVDEEPPRAQRPTLLGRVRDRIAMYRALSLGAPDHDYDDSIEVISGTGARPRATRSRRERERRLAVPIVSSGAVHRSRVELQPEPELPSGWVDDASPGDPELDSFPAQSAPFPTTPAPFPTASAPDVASGGDIYDTIVEETAPAPSPPGSHVEQGFGAAPDPAPPLIAAEELSRRGARDDDSPPLHGAVYLDPPARPQSSPQPETAAPVLDHRPSRGRGRLQLPVPLAGLGDPERRPLVGFVAAVVVLLAAGLVVGRSTAPLPSQPSASRTLVHHQGPAVQPTAPSAPGAAQPQPSAAAVPSGAPSAAPSAAPVAGNLSGATSLGDGATGYQLKGIRYGVHPGDFRVVFDLTGSGVSGIPRAVVGMKSSTSMWVELYGVTGATAAGALPTADPVSGVTLLQPSPVPGAIVYQFTLSRPQTAGAAYAASPVRLVVDLR